MTEQLPNYEQPTPADSIVFRSYGEKEEAEPLLEAMKDAQAVYVIAPNGDALEVTGSFTIRYSDIDRFGMDEDNFYLYIKAVD